ncbi:dienelactone hydrolase family protein [Sneathiella aquimaris]|uniref:dienelactone hydrolase family protein n=1 Tax=Sneathiella aquimaris TaxID=2599305 RepID=UPI00146B42E1|nr:dienelactone hydrolase family protein [Sneathiella aquimaris]
MYARREILKSLGAVPLATILASPELAKAAASTLENQTLKLDNGKSVSAALALPDGGPAPAVMLIHEWWGLNDQIKSVAAEFAKSGYVALAVDLYGGNVATDPEEARKYMQATEAKEATETLQKWNGWLRGHQATTNHLGTVGWCFGGGWSLNASIASPVDATVVYYGNVTRSPEELAKLQGPVQGHFATQDKWINQEMVDGFVANMKQAGQKDPEIYWYEADHAFANPSGGRYDQEDAQLSWQRTQAFLKMHLG